MALLVDLPKLRFNAAVQRGEKAARSGAVDAAIQAFGEAERRAPDAPSRLRASLSRADCLEAAGRLPEVVAALAIVANLDPQNAHAWSRLARACAQAGDLDGERAAWGRLLDVDPAQVSAREALIDLESRAGRHDEAAAHIRYLAELTADQFAGWARLGEALERAGDAPGAIAAWTKATRLDRSDLTPHRRLAELYATTLRTKESLVHRRALTELAPGDVEALRAYAEALEGRGDLTGAADAWSRFAAANGAADEAHEAAAELLLRQGRRQQAIPHLQALAWNSPESPQAWRRLAQIQEAVGDLTGGAEALETALTLEDDPSARRKLVDLLGRLERHADALPHLVRLQAASSDDADLWAGLARGRSALGDTPGAIEAWTRVLALDAASEHAHAELAQLFVKIDQVSQAAPHLRWLQHRRPQDVKLRRRLGRALQTIGERKEAIAVWRRLSDEIPTDLEANQALATLLVEENDLDGALPYQRRAAYAGSDLRPLKLYVRAVAVKGDVEEAIAGWRRVLTLAANDIEAHRELASLLEGRGEDGEAVAHLAWLADLKPDDLRLGKRLARNLARLGRVDEAVRIWERVFDADPAEAAERPQVLAELFEESADPRALPYLRQLAEATQVEPARAWARLARAQGRLGDDEAEMAGWWQVLAFNAEFFEAHARLAELYIQHNLPTQALPHLEVVARREPEAAKHRQRAARAVQKTGSPEAALAAWGEVLALRPDDLEAHEHRVRNLDQLGRSAETRPHLLALAQAAPQRMELWRRLTPLDGGVEAEIAWWKRVLEIAPDDRALLERLSLFLYGLGRKAEAAPYFRALARLEPTDVRVWRRLARCLDEIGDSAGAAEASRAAAMANADPPGA